MIVVKDRNKKTKLMDLSLIVVPLVIFLALIEFNNMFENVNIENSESVIDVYTYKEDYGRSEYFLKVEDILLYLNGDAKFKLKDALGTGTYTVIDDKNNIYKVEVRNVNNTNLIKKETFENITEYIVVNIRESVEKDGSVYIIKESDYKDRHILVIIGILLVFGFMFLSLGLNQYINYKDSLKEEKVDVKD